MSLSLAILPPLIGGLGIFLLGMKHLSEGLQAMAGGGLRNFMARATSHRIVGIGSGIVSTMIVQSSSIITVMLVGFVSTALMTLQQAFAVLIGANIGTTATIWIIAYAPDPQLLGFVGLGLGGILYFFLRGERVHNLGLAVIGLGLVFLGLYFMSKGVSPIREDPEVAATFSRLSADSMIGVFAVASVGPRWFCWMSSRQYGSSSARAVAWLRSGVWSLSRSTCGTQPLCSPVDSARMYPLEKRSW